MWVLPMDSVYLGITEFKDAPQFLMSTGITLWNSLCKCGTERKGLRMDDMTIVETRGGDPL